MRHKIMNPLALGEHKRPTKKHRAAIWECMLGTVYAADAEGNVEYFDYDYDAAVKFAGIREGDESLDLRTWRQGGGQARNYRYGGGAKYPPPYFNTGVEGPERPGRRDLVLWAVRS